MDNTNKKETFLALLAFFRCVQLDSNIRHMFEDNESVMATILRNIQKLNDIFDDGINLKDVKEEINTLFRTIQLSGLRHLAIAEGLDFAFKEKDAEIAKTFPLVKYAYINLDRKNIDLDNFEEYFTATKVGKG